MTLWPFNIPWMLGAWELDCEIQNNYSSWNPSFVCIKVSLIKVFSHYLILGDLVKEKESKAVTNIFIIC